MANERDKDYKEVFSPKMRKLMQEALEEANALPIKEPKLTQAPFKVKDRKKK